MKQPISYSTVIKNSIKNNPTHWKLEGNKIVHDSLGIWIAEDVIDGYLSYVVSDGQAVLRIEDEEERISDVISDFLAEAVIGDRGYLLSKIEKLEI